MSEVLSKITCDHIPEGDSCGLVVTLIEQNAKLRERIDAAHMSRLLTENENEKLRELSARAWRLFTEHGAVHESDLPEVDAVRNEMRELGMEVE